MGGGSRAAGRRRNADAAADVEWIDGTRHGQRGRGSAKVVDVLAEGCSNLFKYRTNRMALIHSPCACFSLYFVCLVIVGAWAYWVHEEGFYMPLDMVTAPSVSLNYERMIFSSTASANEQTLQSGKWAPFETDQPRPRWCTGFQSFMIPGINSVAYNNGVGRTFLTAPSACLTPEVSRNLVVNFRASPYDTFRLSAHAAPTTAPGAGTDVILPTALMLVPGAAVEATTLFDRFVGAPLNTTYNEADTSQSILDFFPSSTAVLRAIAEQQCDVSFSSVDVSQSGVSKSVATAEAWFQRTNERATVYFLTGLGAAQVDLQMYLAPMRFGFVVVIVIYAPPTTSVRSSAMKRSHLLIQRCRFCRYPFQQLLSAASEVDLNMFNFFSRDWWSLLPGPFTDLGNYSAHFFDMTNSDSSKVTDVLPQFGGWVVDMPTVRGVTRNMPCHCS